MSEWRTAREEYAPIAGREWNKVIPAEATEYRQRMQAYLLARVLNPDLAEANNWYPSVSAGDNSLRMVIPASTHITGNVFWQARAMDDNPVRYRSSHGPRGDAIVVVWPPPDSLKGESGASSRLSAIVEGPMDALAAAGEGVIGVALMGMTPPNLALNLTARLISGTIATVVADNDSVGQMTKVIVRLIQYGCACRLTSPHPYKDLAEAPREERRRILGLDSMV